jgi:hypothetical protein
MDKYSLKILKKLIKNKNLINLKNDKEIYNLLFKNKYDYELYQDIISNLQNKEFLYGFKADCMWNNIEVNILKTNEFFIEKRKYFIDKRIMPIITSLFMPVIVAFITTLITTFLINKK